MITFQRLTATTDHMNQIPKGLLQANVNKIIKIESRKYYRHDCMFFKRW